MATISGYTLQDNYIRDIQPNTLYTDFEKNVDSTSTYTIKENNNKISFATSIEGHTVDNTTCFDVSSLENSKKVLLWIDRINEEGHYDIVIGQNGGSKS